MSTPVNLPILSNFDVAGDIVSVPEYYTYVAATATTAGYYTDNDGDDILDYNFANKVTVGGGSETASFTVEVDLGGGAGGTDDALFGGTVGAGGVIPKAVALQCAAFFGSQVIDLSAGTMSFGRYEKLGAAAEKTGAYLLEMTGAAFAQDLAQMDTFKSIAMVDIAKGTAELKDNIPIRAAYVEIAGGHVQIDENLTYAGNMTIVDGSVKIGADEIATYTGIFNDLGIVGGAGTLVIDHGDFSVAQGADVKMKTWISKGTSTKLADDYIDTNLDYKGNYIVGADTDTFFFKGCGLTVNEIRNINGHGGLFSMHDWATVRVGDDTIDVLGAVAAGESFSIGTTDVLELGSPVKFKGVIDHITVGTNGDADDNYKPLAGGEVALDGIWNFVSAVGNNAGTDTIVTMIDKAHGLTAKIAFADTSLAGNTGTIAASEFEFFDQIKGVTPTTVITFYVPPPII